MKILWCFVFYLVFNDFPASAAKLLNENEDTNILINLMQSMEALEKSFDKILQSQEQNFGRIDTALEQNQQRVGALETSFDKILQSQEQNQQRCGALETSFDKILQSQEQNQQKCGALETSFDKILQSQEQNQERFGALEKLHDINVERDDCREKCATNDSCTSVFWNNSSDSKCRFNHDKSTLVMFNHGELYYCKDCQTTLYSVIEAITSRVIRLANVAKNKTTQASSFANAMSDPSKAVDGDPNTWFSSSEAVLTKEEPWLMVDLGQRFLVAQIKIEVRNKPIHKSKGGYFQVCLIDDFDRQENPCKQHSEILKVDKHLIGFINPFYVRKFIMGRYLVIKKLKEESLEIAELEVLSVIPITSYDCTICLAESNTVCDESRIPPVCSCAENHKPVLGDARKGCKDPCIGVKDRNTICRAVSYEEHSCECKNGHLEIFKEEPCFGCLNPCINVRAQNAVCSAIDGIRYDCSCKQDFIPIHHNDPCQGCKVCPSSLGYKNYRDFGCLKAHKTKKNWEDARFSCNSEGGDLFSPGDKLPILPKDEMNLVTYTEYILDRRKKQRKKWSFRENQLWGKTGRRFATLVF